MTHLEATMNYLIKKKPDATIRDWMNTLKEINEDKTVPSYAHINLPKTKTPGDPRNAGKAPAGDRTDRF